MMNMSRRSALAGLAVSVAIGALPKTAMAAEPAKVLEVWYKLILELVRHTATYSPPVASRAFAYLGVAAYEAVASGRSDMTTLAGQLNALSAVPARAAGEAYDDAVVLHATMAASARNFFGNTGPTGQRSMKAMDEKLGAQAAEGVDPDVVARSRAYGEAIAAHVLAWSEDDGGAVVENLGFPMDYKLTEGPSHWVPTNPQRLQQVPLLPNWGKNRTFAMPTGATCGLPPPPDYSEAPESAFYKEALEVYETSKSLTDEQKTIARFWSDDPMLSPTPPGHWISIVLEIAARDGLDEARLVDAMARLGVAVADGFIGCWDAKYQYDLLRPLTYIRRVIDPKWEALLITPPFPEYPSGHSTQSGAAAVVLTAVFGENFAFEDSTHVDDGIAPRSFPNFKAAAEEAALSRLYGGIHFRAAIEQGLKQGECIGAYTVALRTFK